jgi:hypothetical protein
MKKILMVSLTWSLFLGLAACSTLPPSTGFVADNGQGYGYSIKEVKPGFYISAYRGNNHTSSYNAFAYTMLAGYEYCQSKAKVAVVDTPLDDSKKDTYTKVGSYSTPIYGSKGVTYVPQVYSYPVTDVYPNYYSPFLCLSRYKAIDTDGTFETVTRELVHDVTKDFHGGLLVKVADGNKSGVLKNNDVLIKINGVRVENSFEVNSVLEQVKTNNAKVSLIRDQKIISTSVKLVDNTPKFKALSDSSIRLLCKDLKTTEKINEFEQKRGIPSPNICKPVLESQVSSL